MIRVDYYVKMIRHHNPGEKFRWSLEFRVNGGLQEVVIADQDGHTVVGYVGQKVQVPLTEVSADVGHNGR